MVHAVRRLQSLSAQDDLAPLRRHAALARSLLDEFERILPLRTAACNAETAEGVREQLAEELGRIGCRLLECAASMTEGTLQPRSAGQA
jgi:hypothetical protein